MSDTIRICPSCKGPLEVRNPSLYCLTCRWLVYRRGSRGQWIEQVPPQSDEAEIRFRAGLVRLYQAVLQVPVAKRTS